MTTRTTACTKPRSRFSWALPLFALLWMVACSDKQQEPDPTACNDTTNPCPAGQQCNATTAKCEPLPVAACEPACAEPTPYCDEASKKCIDCTAKGCATTETCNSTTGRCETASADPCQAITCKPGFKCDPATRTCGPECDVVAQNCPTAGDKCTVQGGVVRCAPAGSVAQGQPCGSSGDDCAKGLICISVDQGSPVCYPLCNADTCQGCAGGWGCSGLGDGKGQAVTGGGVCTQMPTSCDVMTDSCGEGKKCSLLTGCGDTGCVPLTGSKPVGATCSPSTDDCASGLICLNMGPACFAYCKNQNDCPQGMQCSGFGPNVPFGHCMGGH